MKKRNYECVACGFTWEPCKAMLVRHCPLCGSASIRIASSQQKRGCEKSGEEIRLDWYRSGIEAALKNLTYREREIVRLLFNIGDGREFTVKEIAKLFALTPEGIRQIENRALKKLRQPNVMRMLEKYGLLSKYADMTMPDWMRNLMRKIRGNIKSA